LDPNDPSKGTFSAQKFTSQGETGSQSTRSKRTRVDKPAKKDLGVTGRQTHHTTSRNTTYTTSPDGRVTHTRVQKFGRPLEIDRKTSVKGKIKNDDGTTQQVNVKNFPTRHSSRKYKTESIVNSY
jgi:hypothetical protein